MFSNKTESKCPIAITTRICVVKGELHVSIKKSLYTDQENHLLLPFIYFSYKTQYKSVDTTSKLQYVIFNRDSFSSSVYDISKCIVVTA